MTCVTKRAASILIRLDVGHVCVTGEDRGFPRFLRYDPLARKSSWSPTCSIYIGRTGGIGIFNLFRQTSEQVAWLGMKIPSRPLLGKASSLAYQKLICGCIKNSSVSLAYVFNGIS